MDFVNRLVERTRERRPAIRPVVGASAHTGPADALPVLDVEREIEAPRRDAEERATDAPSARVEPRSVPAPTPLAPRVASPSTVSESAMPALPAPLVTEVDAPAPARAAPLAAAPAAVAPPMPPAREPVSPAIVTSAPDHRLLPESDARTPAVPARSSDGAGEQVIRVHIGRIDVRAPAPVAPQPAAPRRPAEPLPSVALGRYLDDRGRRR